VRRATLYALLGVIGVAHSAHAQQPLFDCGVSDETATIVVVPKNLPQGVAPPQFTRNSVPIPPLLWLSADRHFAEALMLYWRVDDVETKSKFRLVVPFLLDDCHPEARTTLTPLFGWKKDRDGTAGFILSYYFRRDAHRDSDVLFPLYWRTRVFRDDGTVESSSFGIPPLALRLESPDYTSWITLLGYMRSGQAGWDAALWPLWFGGGSATGSYSIIPPLVTAWWSDGDQRTLIVGPYYDHHAGAKHVGGLIPFVFYERAPGENFTLIPPLLTLITDETTIVGPYYSHAGHHGVVPFFFSGPDYLVIPPLLTVHTDETTIVGPYYSHAGHRGIVPLFFSGPDYLLIPPLLTLHTDETTIVGPYYSHAGHRGLVPLFFSGPDYLVIPPLLTVHTDDTTVVGPYYSHAGHRGLVPFFFTGPNYLFIPPLLTLHERDENHVLTIAGPFYAWQTTEFEHDGLLPIWMHGRWRDGTHYLVIPPALTLHMNDGTAETTIVGPGYYSRGADGWDAGVAPIAFAARHGASHYTLVPPALTLHYGDAGSETTIVGPAYVHTHGGSWDAGIAPLIFAARHPGSQYAIVAPLFIEASEGERHFVLIPPLLVGHAGDRDHEFTLAGPFYSWRGPGAEHDGLVPLWMHGRDHNDHYLAIPPALALHFGDGATETTIVGPGYLRTHREGWDAGVAPLAFAAHHGASHYAVLPPLAFLHAGDGDAELTIAGPLFERGTRKNGDHFLAIPPALTLHYGDAASETTIVGPTYLHTHQGGWDAGLAPLVFAAHHGDSHYTLIPPLLTLHEGDREHELTVAGPFYAWQTAEFEHDGLAPVWFHGQWRDGSHYLAIPPALALHYGEAEEETTIVGPAYLRTHAGGGWDAGAAPLFFAADHGNSRYALIGPLLYAKDEEAEITIVGPLLQHGVRKNGDHFLALPPALTLHYGDVEQETTIVGPGYLRTHAAGGWDAGAAPLFFAADHGDSHYALIPPLLTLHYGDVASETTIVGPSYLHTHAGGGWDAGLAPLVFAAQHQSSHYVLVPPALTLHVGDGESETTVVGTGYWHTRAGDWDAGLAPLVFAGHHGNSQYTLLAPPLLMRWSDAEHATTLAGPVYVSTSPRSTTVAVAPLAYYRGSDDSTSLTIFPLLHYSATENSRTVLAPLYYHDSDPTSSHTMVFPFYWNAHDPSGSSRVAFPFYWDFESGDRRITLVPPVALHYRKGEMETNIVGPVAWSWGRTSQGPSWSFHLFPAFSMESARPDHFKWRVLYGLVGRETSGDWHRWQALYMWTDPSHS
jgi:hypothetical protein